VNSCSNALFRYFEPMLATEEVATVGTKVLLFWTTTMTVRNKPLGVVSEGPREDTGDPPFYLD
jgi:hypothetical protein